MTTFFSLSMGLVLIAMTGTAVLLVLSFMENITGRAARAVAVTIVAAAFLHAAPGFAQGNESLDSDPASIEEIETSEDVRVIADVDSIRSGSQRDRDRTVHFATSSGLHFYAGGEVDVTEPADELFAAGGEVEVDSHVSAAMTVVGGDVSVRDVVTDRAIISGGNVEISGTFNKNLIAAGGRVDVEDDTHVVGDVVLAGGNVSFDGEIGGDFIAAGGEVELAGIVGGNANIRASNIELEPGTVIAGNLTYSSPNELDLGADVTVTGAITREAWRGDSDDIFEEMGFGKIIAFTVTAMIATLAALFVFAAVVMAIFSSHFDKANGAMIGQPLQSFGLGALLAVGMPTSAVILFVTIIGIPLGLFAIAAFAVLLGLGLIVAAYWVGLKLRGLTKAGGEALKIWSRLGWTLAGLFLFAVVGMIPILGSLVQFLAIVTGLGAFVLGMWGGGSKQTEGAAA